MQRLLGVVGVLALGFLGFTDLPRSFAAVAQAQQNTAKPKAAQKLPAQPKTDAQIKQDIVRQSIASYSGSCPCPFNTDRAGRSCGRRSAYSRPGGADPFCYESNVTQKMVDDYRKRTK